jgi:shikimate kinase
MKLVFIYGPPASGKLTVANELSKMTGFKLFDNHKVIDLFSELADIKKDSFWDSTNEIKLSILEECIKQEIKGIIFTMVYTKNSQNHLFPKKIKFLVEKNKGKVYFIKLDCSQEEIMKRVTDKSRINFKKFHSRKELEKFTKRYNVHGILNFENQLIINNTKKPAKDVANEIRGFIK